MGIPKAGIPKVGSPKAGFRGWEFRKQGFRRQGFRNKDSEGRDSEGRENPILGPSPRQRFQTKNSEVRDSQNGQIPTAGIPKTGRFTAPLIQLPLANQFELEKAVAVSGTCSGVPKENSGKQIAEKMLEKMFPESCNALNSEGKATHPKKHPPK